MLAEARQFFASHGFLEVDTPILSHDVVVDRYLDPLPVTVFEQAQQPAVGRRMWLQTSPEFAMKRLLVAGAEAIYQITRAFRGGEAGRWHNPEFTIIEWYRVGDSMDQGMERLSAFCEALLGRGEAQRKSYREVFLEQLHLDPHAATVEDLAAAAAEHDVRVPESMPTADRDEWLNLLLATRIEPHLGHECPTILYHYPASQAALARVTQHAGQTVAERFELYVDGLELANGYHELLDADVLQQRSRKANAQRISRRTLPPAGDKSIAGRHASRSAAVHRRRLRVRSARRACDRGSGTGRCDCVSVGSRLTRIRHPASTRNGRGEHRFPTRQEDKHRKEAVGRRERNRGHEGARSEEYQEP